MGFLNDTGLTYLWGKLKTKFSSATNWGNGSGSDVVTSGRATTEDMTSQEVEDFVEDVIGELTSDSKFAAISSSELYDLETALGITHAQASRLYNILNAIIGVESVTVTSTYGTLWLFKDKAAGTVRAYGYARNSSNITIDTVLFTIPSGYRPAFTIQVPITATTDAQYTAAYYGYINSSGEVRQHLGSTIREVTIVAEWKIR